MNNPPIRGHHLKLLSFGIACDITSGSEVTLTLNEPTTTVRDLKAHLVAQYPRLATIGAFRIAVNETFAREDDWVQTGDEVAIIPPVSGG